MEFKHYRGPISGGQPIGYSQIMSLAAAGEFDLTVRAAKAAGFTGAALITAVAVAGAESGYNPTARGDIALQSAKWGPSLGLWQIRSLTPGFLSVAPWRDPKRLTDPFFNARAAYIISDGGRDFSAWTTFTSQAYRRFVDRAQAALPSVGLLVAALVAGYFLLRR